MDPAAELGRNPVSKHQIQLEYGDEQADAGRDCRTRLARKKISSANADREIFIFPVQLTTCRTGNLTRLIRTHTLAICVTTHRLQRQNSSWHLIGFSDGIAVVVNVVSRIQSILFPNPKKLLVLYTVANPAYGLLNREKRNKKKSLAAAPPPPPPNAARSEEI